MLFNSFEYIFIFLPPVVVVYFLLGHRGMTAAARAWLLLCSLFYYSYWNIVYLPLIVGSMIINFGVGWALAGGTAAAVKNPPDGAALGGHPVQPGPTGVTLSIPTFSSRPSIPSSTRDSPC